MNIKLAKHDFKFDKRASVYDEEFEGKLSEKAYKLITDSIEINPKDKILDIGCGTGTILKRVSNLCEMQGFGIDAEGKMIEQAKRKCPQMDIQEGDCSKMEFENETFDCVIACMAFHHFQNQAGVASEVSRVLRTGGKIYIVDPGFPLIVRRIINYILSKHGIVGKFNGINEIKQIFAPYDLYLRQERKSSVFQLLVLEKRNEMSVSSNQ